MQTRKTSMYPGRTNLKPLLESAACCDFCAMSAGVPAVLDYGSCCCAEKLQAQLVCKHDASTCFFTLPFFCSPYHSHAIISTHHANSVCHFHLFILLPMYILFSIQSPPVLPVSLIHASTGGLRFDFSRILYCHILSRQRGISRQSKPCTAV